jgi:hypothetical protein
MEVADLNLELLFQLNESCQKPRKSADAGIKQERIVSRRLRKAAS